MESCPAPYSDFALMGNLWNSRQWPLVSHFSLFVKLQVSRQRGETSDKSQSFKALLKLFMLVAKCERAASVLGKGGKLPTWKQVCVSLQRPFFSLFCQEGHGQKTKTSLFKFDVCSNCHFW